MALTKAANDQVAFEETFMISALSGDGVADLRKLLAAKLPEGPFHYPADQMSDVPMRHLAAEITREKIYNALHQELPYQSTVETETWTEQRDKACASSRRFSSSAKASARSCSARAGRPSSRSARRRGTELADIVGAPVHLFLFVKVREGWENDPERYRNMGLEFPPVDRSLDDRRFCTFSSK